MNFSGNCSLVIRNSHLDFDKINNELNIKPTRIIQKGQIVNRVIGESQYDLWVHELPFMSYNNEPNIALKELLSQLQPFKNFFITAINEWDIYIKCFTQSDLAQIEFDLNPEIFDLISELGLKLKISILSWGGVED